MLRRFSERILGCVPGTEGKDNKQIVGHCVGGIKIKELNERLKKHEHELKDNIILMVGTNDIVKGGTFVKAEHMLKDLRELIETLNKRQRNIVLLTIPPIPKLNDVP